MRGGRVEGCRMVVGVLVRVCVRVMRVVRVVGVVVVGVVVAGRHNRLERV